MSPQPASPAPRTLADLIRRVDLASDLSPRRRQELRSALRTIARLLGPDPALIPAGPPLLVRRLAEIAPAAHGLSRGRWNNIRSLLGAALALTQPMMPGQHREPLTPDWQEHYDRLPSRSQRAILSRFMHHCSAAGIAPEQVNEAVMVSFGAALEQSLLKSPATQLRDTRSDTTPDSGARISVSLSRASACASAASA